MITVATLPIVLRQARRWNLYDAEGPLKIHTRRVPRLGGVALFCGLLSGVLVSRLAGFYQSWVPFVAILIVWLTGLVDDLRNLSPLVRLAMQVIAGTILWQSGWCLPLITNRPLNLLGTCLFVAAFINAFNLLDGADGVAAGVSFVIAFGYALYRGSELSPSGIVVSASLAACSLGFLIFNFPPARIFMGDSGSTLLGMGVAFLSLDFYRTSTASRFHLIPPLVFAALPLLDLALAVARRLRKRTSLFDGDRQHVYDLLLQRGWPARRVTIVCALATVLLVTLGHLSDQEGFSVVSLAIGLTLALFLAVAVFLGALRVDTGVAGSDSQV